MMTLIGGPTGPLVARPWRIPIVDEWEHRGYIDYPRARHLRSLSNPAATR